MIAIDDEYATTLKYCCQQMVQIQKEQTGVKHPWICRMNLQ